MYLLNGESRHCLEFSDRGFQYGDGLFETIEVLNGIPVFLNQHLQRLSKGCKKLLIPMPDIGIIRKEALQLAQSATSKQAVLKLIVTRGSGGRGYRQPETIHPTRLLSLHPFPDYPERFNQQGIAVRFCSTRLGMNPALSGIKHMNRLEQVIARSEWNSSEFQEGLMLDMNGNVIEGTMSNVFIVKENVLYTPIIEQCGVDGIIRNIVISEARKNQIGLEEKTLNKEDIKSADELFVTNSIVGIWPVKQLAEQKYAIGPLIRHVQQLLLAFKQEDIHAC